MEDHAGLIQEFPTVNWPAWDCDATFFPGEELPAVDAGQLYAALVFAFSGGKIALADIIGRGMCIPSGRIEPGETPEQAAVREVWEEVGGRLVALRLLGSYRLVSRTAQKMVRWSPVYVAVLAGLESLPPGSESRGVFLVAAADVPRLYFTWDPLIAAVFEYAEAHQL